MIERIYIHNFRCFENFTLDLKGQSSALIIGKNGSGKSTLRHAINIIREFCHGSGTAKSLIDASDFSHNRTNVPMRFEIDIVLDKKRFQFAIAFEFDEKNDESRILEEKLTIDGELEFSRLADCATVKNGGAIRISDRGASTPVFRILSGGGANRTLRSFFSRVILLSPIPQSMSGFSEGHSPDLTQSADNFAAWLSGLLNRFPARYDDIAKYVQEVFPDFSSVEFFPRGEKGWQLDVHFERQESGSDQSLRIDFKKLSDGEKCFLLSAAVLAFNRGNSPVFCLWDEPDNHLSLPEISHFITALRRMSNQNGQFIAISHHPEVIRSFSDENTLVFRRDSHLDPPRASALSSLSYNGDLIHALLRNEVLE